jgi:hypothetical protein
VSEAKTAENLPRPLPDINAPGAVREILARAGKGEEAMRPLVLQVLDREQKAGDGGVLMRVYGNMYRHAQNALLKTAAGNDITVQESMRRKIDTVRDELAGPDPTPLERILCERVALCWFDAHEMDRRFCDQTDISFKTAAHRESRRDRAHKRFLAACKALATVRKLGVPAIQVNVAKQQVNVVGQ